MKVIRRKSKTIETFYDDIDQLIQGERSALRSYQYALNGMVDDYEKANLETILEDHRYAYRFWSRLFGNRPRFVDLFVSSTEEEREEFDEAIKSHSLLDLLKKGEKKNLSLYRKMLESELINRQQKDKIQREFIPTQKSHIGKIEILAQIKSNLTSPLLH